MNHIASTIAAAAAATLLTLAMIEGGAQILRTAHRLITRIRRSIR